MNTTQAGDNAGHFPTIESARAYIEGGKGSNTSADYHSDRMRSLQIMLDAAKLPSSVRAIDFGCGDGMYFKTFFGPQSRHHVDRLVGIDISPHMIDLAGETLRGFPFQGIAGGVDALANVQGAYDIGFAIDVLGYLDEPELAVFYREMARLIRPGGCLIVMYGNELFDMFALNSGTAAFYQKHFNIDVADVLVEGRSAQYKPANRKNPLSFGAEIAPYGFREVKQAFSQWHMLPPAIGNRQHNDLSAARLAMRDHKFDPNSLPAQDAWQALFRSSIFASLSQRV